MGIQGELEKKWKTPYFNQKLTSIKFNGVGLRGVKNSIIDFNYPITAIEGDNTLEKFILVKLQENEEYAQYIDDSDKFVSFLAHEISLSNHHGVFRESIGLCEEISRMRFYLDEFRGVFEFVEKGLNE